MEIIKIKNIDDKKNLNIALDFLKQGKVVAYPTETVYGLGCDATIQKAIARIYKIKGKSEKRSLLFLVSSFKMADEYLSFTPLAKKIAKRFWPGALSIVMSLSDFGKTVLNGKDGGVRISSNPIATELVRMLGRPIISTSANPTGQPAPQTANEVIGYFKNKKFQPDLIIDAGRLRKSKGSTIVRIVNDNIEVLRQGDVRPSVIPNSPGPAGK